MFTYPAGKSITDFQFPGFVPIFIDSFSKEKKDAAAVFCRSENKLTCIYDFLVTENEAVANTTLQIEDVTEKEIVIAGVF